MFIFKEIDGDVFFDILREGLKEAHKTAEALETEHGVLENPDYFTTHEIKQAQQLLPLIEAAIRGLGWSNAIGIRRRRR